MIEEPTPLPANAPAFNRRASEWGDAPPLCVNRCMRDAVLTVDGVPYCMDCAEAWFDRIQAIELRPELAEMLEPLGPTTRVRLRRPTRLSMDEEEEGRILAERMGRAWALSPFNPANGAPDPNAGRAGRQPRGESPDPPPQPVTPVEPHDAETQRRPAGQLSLLAPEA